MWRSARVLASKLCVAATLLFAVGGGPVSAQSPAPGQPQPPAYRPPVIALAQPAAGGSIPQDKPIVVFRFAQGEVTDPIDASSFRVLVDGVDRTSLFRLDASEAWGPIAVVDSLHPDSGISLGAHQLEARICSVRGACGSVAVPITVSGVTAPTATPVNHRRTIIELLLTAVRKLLTP